MNETHTLNKQPGRWYSTPSTVSHHYEGVCAGCGSVRPAVMLTWRSVFGRTGWCCRDRKCSPSREPKEELKDLVSELRRMLRRGEVA